MRYIRSRLLSLILAVSFLTAGLSGLTASASEDDALQFDPQAAYQGEYTVSDNEYFPGTIVFKTYQATYVTEPITGKTWGGSPSEDYFKLNIKVPVSYNGEVFDQEAMADAPIVFYTPW